MKQNIFTSYFLIIACVLCLNSGCQNQTKVSEELKTTQVESTEKIDQTKEQSPEIKFEKVVLDFGKVAPGTKLTGEFKFTNTGKGLLEITKVARCCGTVISLHKNKYAPGESGVLKATYNAITRTGVQAKQLVVHSNDKTKPSATLTMKAEVVRRIAFTPPILKLLRDKENTESRQITISSLDNQPFSITGFNSTAGCISTEYDPTIKASKFVLDLRIDRGKLQDKLKGSIDLTITHPEANFATIPFEVVPRFTVNPALLIVFNAEPEKAIVRKVSIVNNYNEDFEIESTTSKANMVVSISQHKVSNGYQLEVKITPKKITEGETKFTDVFYINTKGGVSQPVVCHAFYAKGDSFSKTQ